MNPETPEQQARLLRTWLAASDGLLICAGAGMGVDSGLPDFRGNQGFWRAYPALQGRDFTQVASPQTFEEDLSLAWGFYGHRLKLYRQTVPHEGFALLRQLGEALPRGYFVYTSNVDGQFQKAGYDPARVMECHGSIHRLQCSGPCTERVWPAQDFAPEVDEQSGRLTHAVPVCPHCGRPTRPNILMFGDWQCVMAPIEAQRQRLHDWLGSVRHPLVIELGAGTAVPSVRMQAEAVARRGALLRINPRESEVPIALQQQDQARGWAVGAREGAALLWRAAGL